MATASPAAPTSPARRPGDRRVRRQDRLPAHPGVGGAGRRTVGTPARRPARQTPSVHRGLHHRGASRRVGPGGRGARPGDLDERTERLVERIAAMPMNQLIMAKLALNRRCCNRAWPPAGWSAPCSTVSPGIPPRVTRSSRTLRARLPRCGAPPRRTVRRRRPRSLRV